MTEQTVVRFAGKLSDEELGRIEEFFFAEGLQYRVIAEVIVSPRRNQEAPFTRDSLTSRKAAQVVYPRSGTQRHRVLLAIADAGERGATRDELAHDLGLPDSGTDARIWELGKANLGYVTASGRTRKTRAGGDAEVLVLTERGRDALRLHENR